MSMEKIDLLKEVVGDDTVELKPIKAKELLPILEKSNAYGVERFKSLVTF